ncbi:uncharacterized protein LOC132547499 [Ylistrum balloti]|uniref:uncharacterized protein LOC132547499 n=1 Tax=Ylistrum balloti TaxID=509963 RepID=UPI002905BA57|nr:uncharacterized protein LOC132547499 [Ylistrum balloti]
MFQWTKGGRQAAVKYVVVLSDGLVSERMKVKRKARLMSDRHGGITVVSVGLGRSVYHTILESVAFNSSYLLAPDPGKLLDLLQLELQDQNTTDCVKEYNADILVMVETSTTSGKIYKTVMEFLQTFLSKINPNNYDNNITFSLAQYDNKTNYIIRECRLSNLQYIQDAIKELRQSPGEEPDWNSLLRFVDVHTSYTSVKIRKYVMFVTAGHIQKESVAHIKRQLVNLRDNNDVIVVMFGVADHTDWTVLEKVYDRGFYTFSTEDVDVASRVLWNDIKMTNCTII